MGDKRTLKDLGYVHCHDCDDCFITIYITPNAPNCVLFKINEVYYMSTIPQFSCLKINTGGEKKNPLRCLSFFT